MRRGTVNIVRIDDSVKKFFKENAHLFGIRYQYMPTTDTWKPTGNLLLHSLYGYRGGIYDKATVVGLFQWYVRIIGSDNGSIVVDAKLMELGLGDAGTEVSFMDMLVMLNWKCSRIKNVSMRHLVNSDSSVVGIHLTAFSNGTGHAMGE